MVRTTTVLGFIERQRAVSLAVVLSLIWSAAVPSILRAQGARPIEFSESRGGSTNALDMGEGRRQLDSLESQISRSFDFLNPGESLRGAPAPLPRPPARAPVIPRKKPGLFDDDEAWIRSDPLRELDREDSGDEWGAPDRKTGSPSRSSLMEDNWFERSAVGDDFWQLSASAEAPPDSRLLPTEDDLAMIGQKPRPLLENLFGSESKSRSPSTAALGGFDPLGAGLSQPTKPGAGARQDQYRQLLGMEATATPASTFGPSFGQSIGAGWGLPPSGSSPWTASPAAVPAQGRSLNPVRMTEDRPLLPLSPAAPQRPSVQTFYDWDANATDPTPSPSAAPSPFQTPVRRGFQ